MWQETKSNTAGQHGKMVDIIFRIRCKQLAVDHAQALAQAVLNHVPQLSSEPGSGVHTIHVAGSQNGWERPDTEDEVLILSKRTRLQLRVAHSSADQMIQELNDTELQVNGDSLVVLQGKVKTFSPTPTLLARHTYFDATTPLDEQTFISRLIEQCSELDFKPSKVLCGKEHLMKTPDGQVCMRSVLLADVPPLASLRLQDNGLGLGRFMGCGILIPHKDTAAVSDSH